MTNEPGTAEARWTEKAGQRNEVDGSALAPPALAAPRGVEAISGQGLVTIRWIPVPGAVGYVVYRSSSAAGPFEPIDHAGGDLGAVPHGPYADATGEGGAASWYAVSAMADADHPTGPMSTAVGPAAPSSGGGTPVVVTVTGHPIEELARPWRPVIGADHLANLFHESDAHGRSISGEFLDALRIAHRELGVRAVRAHAILTDGPPRRTQSEFDFLWQDAAYDRVLEAGLRPIVELSFMPAELARSPEATVFDYAAPISPPKDLTQWAALVRAFSEHLLSRYGRREVRDNWAFEVWNEPNLRSFWAGSFDDYVEFYDATARAVKRADGRLRVGGPATAAAGWIDGFLAAVQDSGSPLDFLSTHVYGTLPLDMRPPLDRNGFAGLPQWWTEWGVSPTHFADVNDAVFGAPFSLHGMKSALTRIEALTTWVISDHFEELGRPERLFHGGFGLLTVGNLRKPRFWALAMLERLNEWRLEAGVTGDGAEALVDVLATRGQDGRVSVLIWNGTLAQQRARGDDSLAREIDLRVEGLDAGRYDCRHWRIDDQHSNIVAVWERHDGRAWPDEDGWERLAAADHLDEYEPVRSVQPVAGRATLRFDLPMPGVSLLELVPV